MINIFLITQKAGRQSSQAGAAMLIFIIFFTIAITAIATAFSNAVLADLLNGSQAKGLLQAELSADAGAEDMAYRLIAGLTPDSVETISIPPLLSETSAIFDTTNDVFDVAATGTATRATRHSHMQLQLGSGASFNFGVQSGNGGFEMSNGSSVRGNVFSNGTIRKVGGGTATIFGDVISAGPTGLINEITATGTARAREIRNSDVEGDAYAYTLNGGEVDGDAYVYERIAAVVHGATYGHQPEEDPVGLPIPDSNVTAIQQDILNNGTVIASTSPECSSGEYYIDTDTTLGFQKIECDLRIKKQGAATTLTLNGPLWVTGDITFETGPTVVVDSSIANRVVPVIADNPADRITSSRIIVQNGTTFSSVASPKSYVLLLSQNEDAELGGTTQDAIFLGQSSAGDLLLYAGHGRVALGNSVSLAEVTGYLIQLNNSAEVIYESGLVNMLFTSGPGGGYNILSWRDSD